MKLNLNLFGKGFRLYRYQRGVLHPVGFYSPLGGDTVTLNALEITRQTGGSGPLPAVFTVNTDGSITLTGSVVGTSTGMLVVPVGSFSGTYHVKWEDGSGGAANAPDTTPFAKSTWQAMASGPYTWSTTASASSLEQRTFTLHISNDAGSSSLASANQTLISDDTP